ncbi:MAG: peptidase S16 [Actinobacteria bacterium]|nr:MAG: peptidase S16 [Actinomycetota bacterium]
MDEIGLFPLGIVLLPSEQVPLHIFEPRYRELIAQCLEQEREFGLVFADEDGLRAIGTRAAVTEVLERFDDGRLNIVVEGGERFRLVEVNEGNSFHTGEIEPVVDELDPADEDAKERALALFRRLVELTGSDVDEPEGDDADVHLSFALAARFEFAPSVKQELLQSTSERLRLERLCELLENAVELVVRQEEIAGRARTNGKVDPPES